MLAKSEKNRRLSVFLGNHRPHPHSRFLDLTAGIQRTAPMASKGGRTLLSPSPLYREKFLCAQSSTKQLNHDQLMTLQKIISSLKPLVEQLSFNSFSLQLPRSSSTMSNSSPLTALLCCSFHEAAQP
ncbi:hypothetical protein AXF42_Ash005221 [Apostasia shenzhenica]|uniref:Uncharacterized protein n=1 Tax=Apostasia shenzhenica TaxID=1088818 RepID=A0A2I0B6A4_9ASPA|nr:hypothetical protein AXF42_Ash005221 [Apostasia shenzhenica]